jgi:hypothetical protein
VEYTRLPGKKRGFFRRCTLWLGQDHILAVESNHFTESYKRFYFRDLQALMIRKSDSFKTRIILLGILAGVCAASLIAAITWHSRGFTGFSALVLLGLIIALAVHLIKGSTCVCHLKMPLAVHELPSLCRMKYARRVLARITPLVQNFQGSLPLDEIKASMIRRQASPVFPPQAAFTAPQLELPEYSGFVHMIMFGTLLMDAALTLVHYYSQNYFVIAANLITGSALFILTIAALVRQSGHSLPRTVKGVAWVVMVLYTLLNVFMYFVYLVQGIQSGHQIRNQWDHFTAMLKMNPSDNSVVAKVYFFYIIVAAALGIWGLAVILINRRPSKRKKSVAALNAGDAIHEGAPV